MRKGGYKRREGSIIFIDTLPVSGRPFRTRVEPLRSVSQVTLCLAQPLMEIKQCQQKTVLRGGSGP